MIIVIVVFVIVTMLVLVNVVAVHTALGVVIVDLIIVAHVDAII